MKIFISEKEKEFNDAKTVFEDLTVFDPTKGFKHFEVKTIEQHDRELLQEFYNTLWYYGFLNIKKYHYKEVFEKTADKTLKDGGV